MSELTEFRKAAFESWIREQINSWISERGAWDDRLEDEDDDFDEDDWEYIRTHLKVESITITEVEHD